MKVLVTGARGFIGSHLAKRLESEGHQAVLFKGDIRKYSGCLEQAKGCDAISHLASVSKGGESEIFETNILGTLNLLKAAEQNKVKRFHFVSTSEVYKNSNEENKATEDYPADFTNSPYSASKLIGEILCFSYSKKFSVVVNRLFNVYGPGQKIDARGAMISKFVDSLKNGRPLSIWGGGKQKRDWTYVDDIIEGIFLSITKDVTGIINLCSGKALTTLDVVKELENTLKKKAALEFTEYNEKRKFSCGDNSLAKRVLGWSPKIGLEKGIRLLARSY